MCSAVVEWLNDTGLQIHISKSSAIVINDTNENIEEFHRRVPVTLVNETEFMRNLGADISAVGAPQFSEHGATVAHERRSILSYKYMRLMQKLQVFDSTTMSKLVYPAQIYSIGLPIGDNERRQPLIKNHTFQRMFEAMSDAQTEIVGLWPTSSKNFMRGDVQRQCLGLREPKWVVSNNAAIINVNTINTSSDKRVIAVNQANRLDFDGIIAEHVRIAVSVLDGSTSAMKVRLKNDSFIACNKNDNSVHSDTNDEVAAVSSNNSDRSDNRNTSNSDSNETVPLPQALTSTVKDSKKIKAQQLTNALKAAAASCWQCSTSGYPAGTNVSDQVLNANNCRGLYERSSDGAVQVAIKLMSEQHSLRGRGGNFIAAASGEGDLCRGHRINGQRESTQHVLDGTCIGTNRLAIDRHDAVQHYVAKMIMHPTNNVTVNPNWRVTENPIFSSKFPRYKPDMLVESVDGRTCYVLDPTIGYETNDAAVNTALHEKKRKYTQLIAEIKSRGFVNVAVTGLWFGAHEILHKPTIAFLTKTFGIDSRRLYPIAELTMNYTAYIYQRVISDSLCAKRQYLYWLTSQRNDHNESRIPSCEALQPITKVCVLTTT